jgi:hypothetical protein
MDARPRGRPAATNPTRAGLTMTALILVAMSLAGCSLMRSMLLPAGATPAPPESVLNLYLQRLVAGDCDAARELATPTFTVGNGELCGAATVTAARIDGEPTSPREGTVTFSARITVEGGDPSMAEGEQTWFYTLQQQPDGSWRLAGGGSGP